MGTEAYFSKLNYSLANEDNTLEYSMVRDLQPQRILAVCGSGGRSLPLLAGCQSQLVCCDLAEQQLMLAKHRLATFQNLDWRDFLLYWGFAPYAVNENVRVRKQIFSALPLDQDVRSYFEELYNLCEGRGLIYEGKWEKTFTGVPKMLRKAIGDRYDEIFSFDDMASQKAYFDRELENPKWLLIPRLVLRAFGNASFFNAFLYKGHFVKKNIDESTYDIYRQAYRNLFYQGLAKENFFLQLTFLGEVRFAEGNPIEAKESVFNQIKEASKHCKVDFEKQDLITLTEQDKEGFDFVSLSDVPSYFSGELEKNYLQRMKKGLNAGAIVVVRCYLRIPEGTNLEGYEDVTPEYQPLLDQEKTQVYRTFVYRYGGDR